MQLRIDARLVDEETDRRRMLPSVPPMPKVRPGGHPIGSPPVHEDGEQDSAYAMILE